MTTAILPRDYQGIRIKDFQDIEQTRKCVSMKRQTPGSLLIIIPQPIKELKLRVFRI